MWTEEAALGRRSFTGLLNQIDRDAARQRRRTEAEKRHRVRAQTQADRTAERARAIHAKELKDRYVESRIAEAEDATAELADRVLELTTILNHTLSIDDTINFEILKDKNEFPPFQPGSTNGSANSQRASVAFTPLAKPPALLRKLIPALQSRYEVRAAEQQRLLQAERQEYEQKKEEHDTRVAIQHQEIDDFRVAYQTGDPKAIVGYCSMVLERSSYPDGFPQEFRAAYVPDSKQLVVDYELPTPDIVPDTIEYRYVKSKNDIQKKSRRVSDMRELYQEIVAATTIRTCHELFESDQGNHLNVLVFNGFVQAIDRATGKDIRPCLISLRVTRERFEEVNLARIDKRLCLRNLGAQVSPQPYEIQPVKPLVEFDMVDKRFVEQSDILSDLESRPNLMDLNAFEFENLVGNLFKQLGLETKLTRSSRDGGVDVVAFDVRPVLGGKVVIQAKRYKNTVGVSAVRDLFGTMMNEGANKGILVTTSGYGPDAFNFANDKPIELIDGGQLLYLLDQCGVRARIVFPDD